ncbi:MAG: hypothetical protein ACJ8F7_22300 [Gemmataceae bacterium]
MATYAKNPPPKKVAQDTKKFTCWAAALESWISAAKPPTPTAAMANTQDELIASYKAFEGAKDGLMVGKALLQIMFDFQMMVDIYHPNGVDGKSKKALTASAILQRLMMKGFLWCFYIGGPDLDTFLGHAVVIYGVNKAYSADAEVQIMDPWTGTLTTMPVADLNKTDTVFVCWLENSPTWSDDMFRIMSAMTKAN